MNPEGRDTLLDLLSGFGSLDICVVGDAMLDEYMTGAVERISPEAPVPVVRVESVEARPGGAANVAAGIARLQATARLCSVIGTDAAGDELMERCGAAGINTELVVRSSTRPTPRKARVVVRNQQMLRLDRERHDEIGPQEWQPMLAPIFEKAVGALVLSDYAKGVLARPFVERLIADARAAGIPVLVDPRGADYTRYRGATLLKPNLRELQIAAGVELDGEDVEAVARVAGERLAEWEVESMVVTLREFGMVGIDRAGLVHHLPAEVHEVYDVTGAGDTVMCLLAAGLASGVDLPVAMRMANAAAGITVQKLGATPVGPGELAHVLGTRRGDKVLELPALAALVDAWREQGRTVVFTNGCFDLLHVGHLSLLRAAAAKGDALIVGLNSDDSVRRLKGPGRPILPCAERAALLAALDGVDAVVAFEDDTPLRLIETLLPDVLVKGADYRLDEVVGRECVESHGGRVETVPLVENRSTRQIVEKARRIEELS